MILHTLCQTICSARLTNTQPVWLGRQTLLRTLHQNIRRQLLQYTYDNISNIKRKISHPYGSAVTVIKLSPASSTVTPRCNGPLYLIHPFASSARSTSSPLSRRMPFAVISMRKITPCGLNRPPHTMTTCFGVLHQTMPRTYLRRCPRQGTTPLSIIVVRISFFGKLHRPSE